MKKCDQCGLLNEDSVDTCTGCGFTVFQEKPPERDQADEDPVPFVLSPEKKGSVVTLKCRTPREALLVRETLESEDVIALLPHPEEMMQQCEKHGYVEVTVPANIYYSNPNLRSIMEFPGSGDGISAGEKVVAVLLGFFICPGLIFLVGLLLGYSRKGQKRKSNESVVWFSVGVAGLVLFIAGVWHLAR